MAIVFHHRGNRDEDVWHISKLIPRRDFLDSRQRDRASIDWANRQLSYGIRVLEGDPACGGAKGSWDQSAPGSPFHSALGIAVHIKQNLEFQGFSWQAARLENWINRARARGDFLPGKHSFTAIEDGRSQPGAGRPSP